MASSSGWLRKNQPLPVRRIIVSRGLDWILFLLFSFFFFVHQRMRRRKSERKDVVQGDPGNWVRFHFSFGQSYSNLDQEKKFRAYPTNVFVVNVVLVES